MGQTLTHGVYLPDEGERNCYNGLASNWSILDGAVGTVAEHTTALAGKAPAVHTHTKADITDLLNSNFIPSANNSYDLGSSSNQWNNLYAKNYYYNGTAWGLDKNNTWSNTNYFNKTLFCDFSNLANKKIPNEYIQDPLIIVEGDTLPKTWHGGIALERYTNGDEGFQLLTGSYVNGTTQQLGAFRYLVSGDGTESYCYSSGPSKHHLGTSAKKWTTLNGVNPGALSLPDNSSFVSIDTTNWNVSGGFGNAYTPASDGWLHINIQDTATNSIFVFATNKYSASVYGNGSQGLDGRLALMMPVLSGVTYAIIITAGSVSEIYTVKFFPCRGNV